MALQQFEAGWVVGVVGVNVRVKRAGVDDQRDRSVSALRISSIRSDTSVRPL